MSINISTKLISVLFAGTVVFGGILPNVAQAEQSLKLSVESNEYSQAELAQILAPIALYPDSLLTHILIASTYPLEVIEAYRWLSEVSAEDVEKRATGKSWDPSVKALLPFPTILEKLSDELTWMQQLGDAFLADEAAVLVSIQSLRHKADKAGNLDQMDNVEVIRDQETIIIEPTRTEVIYVPYYDTRVVYGDWHWRHHPPVYWFRPHYYSHYNGPFYYRSGIHISVGFYFGAFHWHKRHIVINKHHNRWHHPRKKIVTSHHAKKWIHSPNHRRGVAYRHERIAKKYQRNWDKTASAHRKNQAVKINASGKNHGHRKHQSVRKNQKVHHASKRNHARRVNESKFKYHSTKREKKLSHRQVVDQHSAITVYRKQVNEKSTYSQPKHKAAQTKVISKVQHRDIPRKKAKRNASTSNHKAKHKNAASPYANAPRKRQVHGNHSKVATHKRGLKQRR